MRCICICWWLQRKASKDAAASEYEVTDEKAELVEADEDDEDLLDEGGTFRLGQQDEEFHDFSGLQLKDDAHNRQAGLATWQSAPALQYPQACMRNAVLAHQTMWQAPRMAIE